MAYTSTGRLPIERASKIGHIKIIEEPRIQRLMEAFERVDEQDDTDLGELSGTLDLSQPTEIENVVAIDGSECAIPNSIKTHKKVAFVTAGVAILRLSEVRKMKADPVIDPRDLAKQLRESVNVIPALLPLSGVTLPNETVIDSIRKTVDDVLRYSHLYETFRFLVSREWLPEYEMQEHMGCVKCGEEFMLPRSKLHFRCTHCNEYHTLSDYLSIAEGPPQDWAKEEAASNLRNVLETLILMDLLRLYQGRPVLQRTLFVKDGPLLLRAQLSRLTEPIRAFFKHLSETGQHVHVVGVEKSGALVEHVPFMLKSLVKPGDYFIPSVRYLHERIQGVPFIEGTYRNRVQYGAKVVVRLGPEHVVAFNIPTGDFLTDPKSEDLYGFEGSMTALSEMLSYSYENALIPLVLVNAAVSLSLSPSSDILESFASRLLRD